MVPNRRSFLWATMAALLAAATVTAQGTWKVVGNSGVTAMHMVLVAPQRLLIIDKAEDNPAAFIPGAGGQTGWTAEYNLDTNKFRILPITTNTFCSAGAFLSNGTFVSTAGGEVVNFANVKAQAGFSGVRFFNPCLDETCMWTELKTPLSSWRWYDAMATLPDGSVIVLGGATAPTAVNDGAKNNPTYEIIGANGFSQEYKIQFLSDTLPYNLYPFIHVISNGLYQGYVFIFASTKSVIYDLKANNVVKALPDLPGAIRSYPLTGTCSFLPLTYENNYNPSVLICGGQAQNDHKSPADNTCGRIDLGVTNPAWDMEDFGGIGRVMSDVVIQADAKVVFLNGAGIGTSGYNRGATLLADNPVLTPVVYDMDKPKGSRWSKYAPSTIPRMYHSVATLITDGSIIVAGSNPNENFKGNGTFPTEYRVENFVPPYLSNGSPRPTIVSLNGTTTLNKSPTKVAYNEQEQIAFTLPSGQSPGTITAALIHTGFKTHSQSMSERYVKLQVTNVKPQDNGFVATVWTPPNNFVMPPGPRYLYILNNGTPANTAIHVLIN